MVYNPDDIEIEDQELAYIAGLFDGEVTLTISPGGRSIYSYALQIRYTKTNYDILKYLKNIFGGKIRQVKHQPRQRFKVWQWYIYAGLAYKTLRKLYPFLRIKKEAASTCVEFFERFWQGYSTKTVSLERQAIGAHYMAKLQEYQSKPSSSKKIKPLYKKTEQKGSVSTIQGHATLKNHGVINIKLPELELAYIAGLIDSESSFLIYKLSNRPSYLLEVAYRKTDKNTLQYLANIFGGKVRSAPMSSGNKKEVWVWKVTSVKAHKLIKTIYPLLHIKKRRAELCMEFFELYWQGRSTKPISPERQAIGTKYAVLLKSYNPKSMKHKRKKECDTV